MKELGARLADAVARALGVDEHRMTASGAVIPWLEARLATLRLSSPEDLVEHARQDPAIWSALVGVVLNGQTYFYRDPGQIDAIGSWLAASADRLGRSPRVWCAGCSTGEEPLTLVIEAARRGVAVDVAATDINPMAIAVARDGRYFAWKLRHVAADVADNAFVADGETFCVKDELRARVQWSEHNLVRDAPPLLHGQRHFDLVVCRNVLIYYGSDDVARIVGRLVDATAPGGLVALGASESVVDLAGAEVERFAGRLFLRRADRRPHRPPPPPPAMAPAPKKPPPLAQPPSPPASASTATFLVLEPQARALFAAGDTAGADAVLSRVVAASPADVLALHALAHLKMVVHDYDGAGLLLARSLALDPLSPDVHLYAGVLARKRGDWDGARAALQRCLFLDPRSWLASYLLWGALMRLGKSHEADVERARTRRLLDVGSAVKAPSFGPFFARLAPTAEECRQALA